MADYNGVHVGSYKKRGEVYVRLWWYVGQGSKRDSVGLGRRDKLTKTVIAQARRKQEQAMALQPGRIGAGDAPTWGAWREQYKELRTELSAGSLAVVDQSTSKFSDWLKLKKVGDQTRIDQITRADIATFRHWLAGQKVGDGLVSPMTIVRHIRTLSSMFGQRHGALKLDLIPFNPFDRESSHAAMNSVKSHPDLTDEQAQSLLDACPSTTWRSTVALCLFAGCRIGETFLLTWDDVAWGDGKLVVTSEKQTGGKPKRRTVKMEPELEKVLLEGFEAGDAQPNTMSKNNLNRNMTVIIKHAGLEPWREPFQALRRWRDSTWKLKYPEYVVDAWMGHGVKVSRKHYLTVPDHLYQPPGAADRIKTLIDKLDAKALIRLEKIVERLSENYGATSARQ